MNWFSRRMARERDRALDEEIAADFALEVQQRIEAAASREEAEWGARRDFGNVTRIKEVTRSMWGKGALEEVFQDARFAWRTILRDRTFFFTAVFALALGIGSTTAIFSVVYNVLLYPFPYRDAENLYCPFVQETGTSRRNNGMIVPEFLDLQQSSLIFTESMGITEESVLLEESGRLKEFDADRVTGNAFQFLGMPALVGRGLLPGDAEPGAPPVFVLNHRVWQQDFRSDPQVVGKTFRLNGIATTLVGVMPPRFSFWDGNLWLPLPLDRTDKEHTLVMYGHLRPGLTSRAAAAELTPLAVQLAKNYPKQFPKRFQLEIVNLLEQTVSSYKKTIYLLVGAVGLLLLIACANVSNLLLARATARERELAIRISLGSGRARLIRQLLVESVLLALSGAVAGCFFAWAGLRGLMALVPMWTFPDEAVVAENIPVLLLTVAVAMVTGIVFGLAPAVSATRGDVNEALKAGGRGHSGFGRGRLRHLLIVSEVAFSLLLLTSSGLLMRSFIRQRHVETGVRSDGLLTTHIDLPARQYKTTASQVRFLREFLRRMESHRGVASAGVSTGRPPYGGFNTNFDVAGLAHSENWSAHMTACSHQLFSTVGARLVAGRFWTEADENGRRRVAVVNRTMAAKYFGGRSPIGQHLQLAALKTAADPIADPWFEVVGVVSDMKNEGTRNEVSPEAYLPYTIEGFSGYTAVLRTVARPEAFVNELTAAVLALDRAVIPQYTWTMNRLLDLNEYSRPRFFAILLAVFAAIGLALVSLGVYSVIAYTVLQQRREIGIRMALGATANAVRFEVIASSLRFVWTGAAIGIGLTLLLSRVIASQVWGVAWYDPVTLGGVLLLLICVGCLGALVPSFRASHVEPMICLRHE